MTRDEAIGRIKARFDKWALDDEDMKAIQTLIPELAESEDERIRKVLVDLVKRETGFTGFPGQGQVLAWLKKQKENIEKEYVFRPLAGTDITIAAEQAIRRADEGDRLVLAFNGAYIPVRKGVNANKIVDIYDAFIEKQKDASKAIEAVDRIDKYIDEHVANAHDMKDSNPDKKYYRGWDDALGEMARILQDVYSEKKQKESLRDFIDDFPYSDEQKNNKFAPRVLPCSAAWFEDSEEKQQEQKHTLKFKVGDKVHLEGDDVNILTITGIEKDRYLTDNSYGPILFGAEDIWQIIEQKPAEKCDLVAQLREYLANTPKEQLEAKWKELEKWNNVGPTVEEYLCGIKPAEWSDEDRHAIENCEYAIKETFKDEQNSHRIGTLDWLKNLPERFNLRPKNEWSEDYREKDIQTRFAFYTYKDDPSTLYLSNIFVEEASRNHGFGTRILRAAEKVAEIIGATTISLKVKQDSPANTWYRKNGYGYVAFEDGYDWLKKNLEYMKPKHSTLPIEQQMEAAMIAIRGEMPSNSQEWSEEDEKLLNKVEVLLDDYCDFLEDENSRFIPEVRETISRLKSLRPQPKDEIYKEKDEAFKLGKHQLAIKFMNYLDENRPEGKMSLSNAECEDIDKAFKENDWERIMRYVNKYAWKPSKEQVEALEDTMTYIPEYYKPKSNLASLLRDLKKQV